MRSGAHDVLVVFQQKIETRSGPHNELQNAWSNFAELWVSMKMVRGRERAIGNSKESEVIYRVMVDALDGEGLKPDMRMLFNPAADYSNPATITYFEIMAVKRDFSFRETIEIDVREVDEHATRM